MPEFVNDVRLRGSVDRTPEFRRFASGSCNLTIRLKTSARGDWQRVVVWAADAERMAGTEEGAWIEVIGRNQTRSYTDKDGRKVYITEVVAQVVDVLEDASCEQPEPGAEPARPASANPQPLEGEDEFPF